MSRKVINVVTGISGNSNLLLNFNFTLLEDTTMATPESETKFKLTELGIETVLGMSIENYKKNRDIYTNATVKLSSYVGDILYCQYYYICELIGNALVKNIRKYMYMSKAIEQTTGGYVEFEFNFDENDNFVDAYITLTPQEEEQ